MVTLRDLALKLNVSVSTVSRALNGAPNVHSTTRQAVQQMAKKYGYTPNRLAREFKSQKPKVIGVIIPSLEYPLYAQVISGIEEAAEQAGFHTIICQSKESEEREVALMEQLISYRVAGILVSVSSGTSTVHHFERCLNNKTPLVFFNRYHREIDVPRVVIDNFEAAVRATSLLLATGIARLSYIGGPENVQVSNQRMKGFFYAVEQEEKLRKKRINSQIIHVPFQINDHSKLIMEHLRTYRPQGILAYSDRIAKSVFQQARSLNICIPEQLAVIGFNDEPYNDLFNPPLASISQPALPMGKEAFSLLHQWVISGQKPVSYLKRVLSSSIYIRGSLPDSGNMG